MWIQWWYDHEESKNGKFIRPPVISKTCSTDTSLHGFGFYNTDTKVHGNGRWNLEEKDNDINYLELLAIIYALKSLYCCCHNEHICIQSDNVTAVSYINNFGGIQSIKLDSLAKDV